MQAEGLQQHGAPTMILFLCEASKAYTDTEFSPDTSTVTHINISLPLLP